MLSKKISAISPSKNTLREKNEDTDVDSETKCSTMKPYLHFLRGIHKNENELPELVLHILAQSSSN